MTGHKSQEN